ncbi:MAG: hypothetical protein QM736_13040 [Vicinamibacterales bacterium]
MSDHTDETALRRSLHVRVLDPDPERAARVRARCRQIVATPLRRSERSTNADGLTAMLLQPAVVGGLCLCYLLATVYDLVLLYGGR